MAKFFEKFPTQVYDGVNCKLITTRTALSASTREQYLAYNDVPVQSGDRPDTISYQLYDDQYLDWLVYYANGIVDPYYQWCLDDESLQKTIEVKYGSIAEAQERVLFYRVKRDDSTIDTAAYNSLASSAKKYWEAVINEAGAVLYYKRSAQQYTVNTNQLVKLTGTITEINISKLANGERVTQVTQGRVTASGQILHIVDNVVTVGCIEGTFVPGAMTGASTEVQVQIGEVQVLGYSIPEAERSYWEPVTCYEYEVEQNEQYRTIKALVPGAATVAASKHEELLNG